MADGFAVGLGEGERVSPAMTFKVGDKNSTGSSMSEVVDTGPGFDVGAHLHRTAEELFYVLEGELDLLAFEPRSGRRATGRAGSRAPGPRWPAAGRGA